jgi:hypothetical protein
MAKLSVALSTFVLALVLPVTYALASKPPSNDVAQTLLRQMNSGPDGRLTRAVTCARVGAAVKTFDCSLQSLVHTRLGARVTQVDGGLRTVWQPLEG